MTVWHEVVDFDVILYCMYSQMGATGIRYLDLASHRGFWPFPLPSLGPIILPLSALGPLLSELGRIMPVWLVSQVLVRIKRKDVEVVYKL